MTILKRMLILSEYPNYKKTFYTIYEHHCLVQKYKRVGLCPMRNEDLSVSLTATCENISCQAFMGRPSARLETMVLVIRLYVLV